MNLKWSDQQPELGEAPVVLRAWRTDDAPLVYEACQDEMLQQFTMVPVPYEMSDAEEFIAKALTAWEDREEVYFAIVDNDDQVTGAISLMNVNAVASEGEIGYWVADWARGNHIARQAISLLGEWAVTEFGLDRVIMKIQRENVASIAAALAAGAVPTGTHTEVEHRDELVNLGIYELT